MSVLPKDLLLGESALVAGAGGGFDFLCGLPVAVALEARGCKAYLANYSFSTLQKVSAGCWHREGLLEVGAKASMPGDAYFPEGHLAQWLERKGFRSSSVYCLDRLGVVPTLASYNYLIDRLQIDTVICVDGGVDGLFRGDEHDLGTPSMDSISVIATALCQARYKIYVTTAFGVEGSEGSVSHAQALRCMASLTRSKAWLGVGALLRDTSEGSALMDAARLIFQRMAPVQRSIIVSSILAALDGEFGRVPVTAKVQDNPPWISPLTALYWFFDACAVARQKYFYEKALNSTTVQEVSQAIEEYRAGAAVQPYEPIPI